MRKPYIILLLFFSASIAYAQPKQIDTLRLALSKATADTDKLNILRMLGYDYFISNPDSCIIFSQQAYELAVKYKQPLMEARMLNNMANAYATMGDYVKGIQFYLKALRIHETLNNIPGEELIYDNIGATYVQEADYKNALRYLQMADRLWEPYILTHKLKTLQERRAKDILYINFGECYLYTGKIDLAERYLRLCNIDARRNSFTNLIDAIERDLGEVEIARGHKAVALKHLHEAITAAKSVDDPETLSISYLSTAKLYHNNKQQDSAEYYATQALETAHAGKYEQDVLNAGQVLYHYYEEDHNLPQAYKYYKLTTTAKDSLYSQDRVKQLLSMEFDEKQRKLDIETAQNLYQEKVRSYALLAGLVVLLFLAIVFWRNNRQNKKAKIKIQKTLDELKVTQQQLIQSEKMASLGELTAGIAHEIQNPLNFVNNFSEVNMELLDEMETDLQNGDKEDAVAIAANIRQNLEKIRHHGQRADGIVKGMLQHSRASSDTKEPIDINKLADEYLRLAYHGLRAKDKSFNAEMVTHLDKNIHAINIVPQDIGRVLLNLFTNAFYAVQQRQKTENGQYKPVVEVTTSVEKGMAIIKVKDNGNGISENIKDKIMQPFFTTKPAGAGTGLGLSLSYDTVVKRHSGTIKVNSKEGEGSEFTIELPVS
ncbi:MAG TPA: ATP-binding protein [Mucilaginibacter sp.]|jgi:signal transduction histidine kinase